jgi:hypothetical protein
MAAHEVIPSMGFLKCGADHHFREARHPNVVLYLGLSRAPEPDNRIFIISEFIENGLFQSFLV